MTGIRNERKPAGILFLCTAFIFFLFIAGTIDYYGAFLPPEIARMTGTEEYSTLKTAGILLVYFILFLLLFRIMWRFVPSIPSGRITEKIRKLGDAQSLILLLLVTVIPRIIWLLASSQPLESDYALYTALGREYAETGTLAVYDYLLKIAPNVPMYAALLGNVMKLFGTTDTAARWFCLLLYSACVPLVYGIGRNMTTRSRALLAALLFSLLPENIFYAALPGIEGASMFAMLAGLLLITGIGRRKPAVQILMCAAGGVLIAFSACLRPNAWVAAGAAALWLIIRFRSSIPIRRIAACLAAAAVGAASVMAWHHAFQNHIFTGEKPAGMAIGWSLYEGLDLEYAGRWSQNKSDHCLEVIRTHNAADANRVFMTEAWERFNGYSFPDKIRLFLRKGGSVWIDSSYAAGGTMNDGIRYALPTGAAFIGWMVFMSVWLVCLVFRGLHPPADRNTRNGCVFCLAVVLLTALWHEFGTSISRYHYMVIPFMTLMTAMMIPGKTDSAATDDSGGIRETANG